MQAVQPAREARGEALRPTRTGNPLVTWRSGTCRRPGPRAKMPASRDKGRCRWRQWGYGPAPVVARRYPDTHPMPISAFQGRRRRQARERDPADGRRSKRARGGAGWRRCRGRNCRRRPARWSRGSCYDEHDHWKLLSMCVTVARTWPRREPVGGRLRWSYLERDLHDGPLARGADGEGGRRSGPRRKPPVPGADRCRRGARARGAVALAAVDHLDVEEGQSLPEHGYARRKSLRLSVRVKARVWL